MSSSGAPRGHLFIVSAPSGAGKTTVVTEVIRRTLQLTRSRSYTSRKARVGEVDGVDYHYVSRERFEAMRAGNQFLEWAEFSGHLYGTSEVDTERILATGEDLVLVIDVQGGRQVRRRGLPAVSVFLLPPSFAVLERRLRERGDEAEEQIQRRLRVACDEVGAVAEHDYVVINDTVESCVERLRAIVVADRALRRGEGVGAHAREFALADQARRDAMAPVVAPILAGFERPRT